MINRLRVKIIWVILIFCMVSCRRYSSDVGEALKLAGDNRVELEKVLDHYSLSESDSLKYKAACFLIANMTPYYAIDSMEAERFKPFYKIYDSIYVIYRKLPGYKWQKYIPDAWDEYKQFTPPLSDITEKDVNRDLESIKADWLIEQIDVAFAAWQSNVFTKDDSFEDFCEYILPYRRQNGVLLDNARKNFYLQFKDTFFEKSDDDFLYECDNLFRLHKYLGYSWDICPDLPILNIETLIYLKNGSCFQRAWFNTVLLSSVGVGAAIDFVPRWGNRSPHHSWNVARAKGKSYPFDAFALHGKHWENGRIYDNKCAQERLGKWRLPKVFRYTFPNHMDGPGRDKRVLKADVPSLFQNTKIKDVSDEYFETKDITIDIPKIPHDTYYAYLCVLGDNRDWIPVYWGEIKNGKAIFEKMGKDIVYMPAFYKNGAVIPIKESVPFWVKPDGSLEFLKATEQKQTVYLRETNGDNIYLRNQDNISYLKHSVFLGKTSNGTYDTLSVIPDSMGIYRLTLNVGNPKKYRFIRMQLPTPMLAVGDITFYAKGSAGPVTNVLVKGRFANLPDRATEEMAWITDNIPATGYLGKAVDERNNYLDFDLGEERCISAIGYAPYVNSNMKTGKIYRLFCWINGEWNFVDKQDGNGRYVIFDNVPKGGLYTVKSSNPHKMERIFTYEDHEALWH